MRLEQTSDKGVLFRHGSHGSTDRTGLHPIAVPAMALRTGEDEIRGDLGMEMQAPLVIHELQVGRGPGWVLGVRYIIAGASGGLSTVWAGD